MTRPMDPLMAVGFNMRQPEIDALRAENERLRTARKRDADVLLDQQKEAHALRVENERLRAALVEISDLDLEGDASLADAIHIADEAINP